MGSFRSSVYKEGVVAAFGRSNPDKQIRAGDRFVSVNGVQLRSRSDFERAITLRENMSATLVRTADPVGLLVRGTSRSATVSEDILDLLRSKSAEFAALGLTSW